ncbi:MAG: SusC/RagA family TonB-linked outer membrane protein, partial [Bacteroidales bacterium]
QDINGDGKIDTYDRVAIGYTNMPEIVYGFGMTANWKNFDVNVFFQGVSHVSFFTGGTSMEPFTSGNMGRAAINADLYDHVWKTTNTPEQNAKALYPRLSIGGGAGSSNNYRASTATLRDGSFLRLKNVEIGYTLPKAVLRSTFINNFRVYMAGNNLATFSKFKLWDPERGNGDGSGYPPSRIVSLGITANF